MKRLILIITAVCGLLFMVAVNFNVNAANEIHDESNINPPEQIGKKYRIGYAETDPYYNFAGTLHGIINGLESIGWVDNVKDIPYTDGQSDSKKMWQWLTTNNVSPYLEFVEDAHYSFIEPGASEALKNRLENIGDLDLIIVMGTDAGRQVASFNQNTPTFVFSSSNAVDAGIIRSAEDSGIDHVWAHVDSERYIRQLEVFHDLFSFKKLGIIYENSENGKVYAAYDDIKMISQQEGRQFEVVEYHVNEPSNDPNDVERYHEEVADSIQLLSEKVDAFYLTSNMIDKTKLYSMLEPLNKKGIPVFSQMGATEVEHGALLSLYRANFNGIGRFGAEAMVKALKGEKPRALSQIYGDTPSIVLNLQVAKNIGYKPPFEILLVADEIYQTIKTDS